MRLQHLRRSSSFRHPCQGKSPQRNPKTNDRFGIRGRGGRKGSPRGREGPAALDYERAAGAKRACGVSVLTAAGAGVASQAASVEDAGNENDAGEQGGSEVRFFAFIPRRVSIEYARKLTAGGYGSNGHRITWGAALGDDEDGSTRILPQRFRLGKCLSPRCKARGRGLAKQPNRV